MPETTREKKVRVVLYVPEGIHSCVTDSMQRFITVYGKQVPLTKTQNEAYLDFIKRGIATLEDEPETKE